MEKGVLVLRDGTVVWGTGFGSPGSCEGEVVFDTAMVGYPEYLTDPSFRYNILMPTFPLVGNYGVSEGLFESERIQVEGLVVGEWCDSPSHAESKKTLDEFLKEFQVPGLSGVDTRFIARKIRLHGVLEGILKSPAQEGDVEELVARARKLKSISDFNLIEKVTPKSPVVHEPAGKAVRTVVVLDCGVKLGIVRALNCRGVKVIRVPARTSAKDILDYGPDGVLVSNGPGDPKKATFVIKTVKGLVDEQIPMMGVCMGNQLVAIALGGDTFKLKFGHRGGNHPVKDLKSGRVYITSQNHGFAVDPDTLDGTGLMVTHKNLNDGTVEGIRHKKLPVFCVQYHPEASPGPWDTGFLFDEFKKMMR